MVTDPVLADDGRLRRVVGSLRDAGLDVVVFSEAAVDVPMATIDAAHAAAREARPDVVVAVGGGSAIDLAKVTALLLAHGGPLSAYYGEHLVPGPVVPLIALPTTAGTGSEVTPVSVIGDPELGMKVGISSPYLIPRTAICDPELTRTCPRSVTAHSGIDALSHAIEAFMAIARPPDAGAAARAGGGRQERAVGRARARRGPRDRRPASIARSRTGTTSRRARGCCSAR